ncbi:hypothetical protein NDJ08_01035 [Vibrio alginolyticus]|uniref:hypothetical protein n=1 Tax=Vibrio TaxID=662 RepID=UPI002161015F|nr:MULTISPECIES: hypothetical protein [Vibrio]EJN3798986.1 hypothetical protein [Vibrio alginolyticus]EJX2554054.1 hypothetical protein [Vibrio alginolyticus]EMA9139175.1 hypothetical protein [Vibrio alginolyticus]MCS0165186.1 hypothetical protein [Vibrio alginolyticus]MDW1895134.1 hypothetical protein [Vibrio sp. Vb1729]
MLNIDEKLALLDSYLDTLTEDEIFQNLKSHGEGGPSIVEFLHGDDRSHYELNEYHVLFNNALESSVIALKSSTLSPELDLVDHMIVRCDPLDKARVEFSNALQVDSLAHGLDYLHQPSIGQGERLENRDFVWEKPENILPSRMKQVI